MSGDSGRTRKGESLEKEGTCPVKKQRFQRKGRREDIFRWIELFTFFLSLLSNLNKLFSIVVSD